MSTRAKRKARNGARGDAPTEAETTAADPPKKRREPVILTVLGLVVFFVIGVFVGVQLTESWAIGLACGVAAFVLGGVLAWKGESLLDALSSI